MTEIGFGGGKTFICSLCKNKKNCVPYKTMFDIEERKPKKNEKTWKDYLIQRRKCIDGQPLTNEEREKEIKLLEKLVKDYENHILIDCYF